MEEAPVSPHPFSNLGRIPRDPKPTDYPADILLGLGAPAPAIWTPSDAANLPITYQGQEGACGGFSIQYGFVLILYRALIASGVDPATAQYLALSPRSAYAIEKFIDGTGLNTVGTTIEAVAKAFVAWGIALESLFPSTDTTLPNNVYGDYALMSDAAKADAATRAQNTYAYFFSGKSPSFANLKEWIAQYGFVLLEVEVGDEWWTSQYGKVNPVGTISWADADINPVVPPKTIVSGHFILATSYDDLNIYGPNSWSKSWGKNGWYQLQENYVPFITNALVFHKIPASVKQALSSQQAGIAQQILNDMAEILQLVKKEI